MDHSCSISSNVICLHLNAQVMQKNSKTMKWAAFVESPLKLAAAAMQKLVTRSGMQGFCCVGKKCCFARVQSAHKNY